MAEAPKENARTSTVYVARFRRAGPVLVIVSGLLLPVLATWFIANASSRSAQSAGFLYASILSLTLLSLGTSRLIRGWRSQWIALAIDSAGIHFAAQPGIEPRTFSWDEISAVVMFSRRSDFIKGKIGCIGLRLHPCSEESPETLLKELQRRRFRSDLERHEQDRLTGLADELSGIDLEMAVSFHAETRGWGYRRRRLREAMRAHAPGVPVVNLPSQAYYDLVGWRAQKEQLGMITEDAELDRW